MPDKHATLEEVDGRPALRFERVLPHPPERVWTALTDTDEMFAWHPTPASFEPRVGGRVAGIPTATSPTCPRTRSPTGTRRACSATPGPRRASGPTTCSGSYAPTTTAAC